MRAPSVEWTGIDKDNPKYLKCYAFDRNLDIDDRADASNCVWPRDAGGRIFCCGYHSNITNRTVR